MFREEFDGECNLLIREDTKVRESSRMDGPLERIYVIFPRDCVSLVSAARESRVEWFCGGKS